MPTLSTTPTLAVQLSDNFDSDWSAAQDKYNDAIKAGYDAGDAESLYLAPVRAKWQMIQSSPNLIGNPSQLKKFSTEFNDTAMDFQSRYNSNSRDGGEWAANQTIKPLLEKWSLKASLPAGPNPQQQITEKAYQEYAEGKSPREILREYPSLALDKSFDTLVAREINTGNREPALNDVQKATRDVLSSNLKTALSAGTSTDRQKQAIADAQKALNQFDEKYVPKVMGRTETASLSPGAGSSAVNYTPSLTRSAGPLAPAASGPNSGVPDLTGNPSAVAQLANGTQYTMNGHLYRADHATPLPSGAGLVIGNDRQGTFAPAAPTLTAPTAPPAAAPSLTAPPSGFAGAPNDELWSRLTTNPLPVSLQPAPSTPENTIAEAKKVEGQDAEIKANTDAIDLLQKHIKEYASTAPMLKADAEKKLAAYQTRQNWLQGGNGVIPGSGPEPPKPETSFLDKVKSFFTPSAPTTLTPAATPTTPAAATPAPTPAAAAPITATNPQTGQKMVWKDGSWQAMQP